ncbi:MAG: aspartyl-tRNA(Asn)/glutamyl-tRNA(Gln) amidotransferase subunit A [Halieaceae bacterium]|jgi:aspartyl-tRNA(Asn)/glutamyl-tRNA(Gln) amidotransferase subunit A
MHHFTIAELISGMADKSFSSEEITRGYLERIAARDGDYNSFITVTDELAVEQAQAADRSRARGEVSKLTGIPLAHKDIFCTNGIRTSCGSKMLANFVPPYNATVIDRLATAGAVCLGKTNMDEFAMGSSNESSYYGPVRNPWAMDSIPGGSSGGSAAAVAAGLAAAATGTDTGGSIRQPAAFCGLSGIKPSYGRVSRLGMVAFASSLDQGGPIARTVEDAALLLESMAGFDPADSTSVDLPVPDYTKNLNSDLAGLKVGVPSEFFDQGLNPGLGAVIEEALVQYEKLGATLVPISLPHSSLAVPAYYVIAPAEASTNLSRFDGVRYGHRCKDPADLFDLYTRSRAEGFGEEVKRRILVGTYALSAGYYDAYYRKAQQIRRLIKQDYVAAFTQVDVIMGPTTPNPAWKMGAKSVNPVDMYLEDIYTLGVNLAGLPAMSIPAGFLDGKPVGLQIIGNYFAEAQLLNVGHQFQLNTDWHRQTPTDSLPQESGS